MQNHSRHDGPFAGRTVAVVNDLSLDEQLYLYRKARDIKAAAQSGADLSAYRLDDRDYQVYLIFMVSSFPSVSTSTVGPLCRISQTNFAVPPMASSSTGLFFNRWQ